MTADATVDTAGEEQGPVDYLVVEFATGAENFTGEMAAELALLSESGAIRILDITEPRIDCDPTTITASASMIWQAVRMACSSWSRRIRESPGPDGALPG